jgi:hypothetical protein
MDNGTSTAYVLIHDVYESNNHMYSCCELEMFINMIGTIHKMPDGTEVNTWNQ